MGTKLELVITEMAEQIENRTTVVRGAPIVEPSNDFFWFNKPQWILFLIHFTLFQVNFLKRNNNYVYKHSILTKKNCQLQPFCSGISYIPIKLLSWKFCRKFLIHEMIIVFCVRNVTLLTASYITKLMVIYYYISSSSGL